MLGKIHCKFQEICTEVHSHNQVRPSANYTSRFTVFCTQIGSPDVPFAAWTGTLDSNQNLERFDKEYISGGLAIKDMHDFGKLKCYGLKMKIRNYHNEQGLNKY